MVAPVAIVGVASEAVRIGMAVELEVDRSAAVVLPPFCPAG